MKRKIAFLGPKGTFTEMAVHTVFEDEIIIPYETIPSCIDAVMEGEVDYGVVPLENAIEGSVNLTIDYLIHEQPLPIVGEVNVPIRQHLMVHSNHEEDFKETELIVSHPHAIAQCHRYIRNTFPHAVIKYMNSTGAAAKYVSEHPEQKIAAIGNSLAAKEYGLAVVEEDIHDYVNNVTKFVVLHRTHEPLKEEAPYFIGYKTSFLITLPSDYPGALHQVLSAFAWRKLNLSKIESRPAKTGLGNYFFIIDIEQKIDDVLIPGVKAELEALGCGVTILGSYPIFSLQKTMLKTK